MEADVDEVKPEETKEEAKDEEEALKSITVKNRRERTKRIEYYAHSQNIADEVNIVLNKDRLKRMKKK